MKMKSAVFWDVTPSAPVEVDQYLGGMQYLHLQDRVVSQASNQREAGGKKSESLVKNLVR
jgi:hypothetical protein